MCQTCLVCAGSEVRMVTYQGQSNSNCSDLCSQWNTYTCDKLRNSSPANADMGFHGSVKDQKNCQMLDSM